MEYKKFLENKVKIVSKDHIITDQFNPMLFDFQKHIVQIALKKGRYAIFADTGLGKTPMQLEWSDHVQKHTNGNVLILAPLAVSGQTIQEGKKFGYKVNRLPVKGKGIYISNYEQLDNIDSSLFSGIVLDESSILKNYTGKYKQKLIKDFKRTPYKLACTATPSPNDINEIGNHSEFLNILDAQDMRAKWFIRDEGMNNYRLKKHAKQDFYNWISSWCVMFSNPSEIGFQKESKKYKLPGLNYIDHVVESSKQENWKLFNDGHVNATSFSKEIRRSIPERLKKVAEIVNNSSEKFIIWVNLNDEESELKKLIPDAVCVNGSEKTEIKEKKLLGFANNEFRILLTKKKIAQFGLNYQNCNNQVFAGLDFSFEGLYQAIRRSYRFGQKKEVNIYIISTDTMENVVAVIKRKEQQFNELQSELRDNINNKYGLVMDYIKEESKTDKYHIIKGDSVEEIDNFKDNSFDFSIFSPPFSMLFTYTNSYRDMGNCDSHSEFFEQNQFLLNKLYRKMKPGKLVAVHSKDLAVYKNSSGYTGLYDFTGDYHRAMEKAGFKYHSKITIWTDPVLEMQRTKTQRLLYKQLRKDSLYSGVGLPEYITIFKKWEDLPEDYIPVNNKNFENFNLDTWQRWASPVWGEKLKKQDLIDLIEFYTEQNGISHDNLLDLNPEWLSGTWFDIRRTDVLNKKDGRSPNDEKHIAPLQLTVIDRAIKMWTNPGEVVFTPFMGIGSEVYITVRNNRFGIGIELKDSYYEAAKRNLNNIVENQNQLQLL